MVLDKTPLPDEIKFTIPGFISNMFYTLDPKRHYVRTLMMPEDFSINMEKAVIGVQGIRGKRKLYQIGKKFGYRFSLMNRFPKGNISNAALHSIYQFFEMAYAKKMYTYKLDAENKFLETYGEDVAIISSGEDVGYSMDIGGWCGIWCYLNNDYTLETCSKKISKDTYLLVSGSRKDLKEKGFEVIEGSDFPELVDINEYIKINKSQMVSSRSIASFDELFNRNLSYSPGKILMRDSGERIIPTEISWLFDLEKDIDEKVIYDASYVPFYSIGMSLRRKTDPNRFLEDLFTGFGFGVVGVVGLSDSHSEITFTGYPWFTDRSEKSSFAYIRGAVVGLLNGATGRNYRVSSHSAKLDGNVFTVTLDVEGR